ncbi:putative RiPP precursor [Mesorhizobium sp. CU2]|nr:MULTISPECIES: putative RiPP precursor [unclassified Mesorhizobium]TPN82017.1 putative RiPP precursor [Mesorhizobium sp. CU3]TPO15501.1 putative RiPP precursor [Mesorhizobium sp. CU2]
MKKTYEKPTLIKKDRLSAVTANGSGSKIPT